MQKLVVVAVVFLWIGSARAQTCQQMIDDMRARSAEGKAVYANVTSSQANKITTSAGGGGLYFRPVRLVWVTDRMTSDWPGSGSYSDGWMQFNDRNNPSYVTGAAQNLSTHSGQMESFDMWITATSASIRNNTWGYLIQIPQLSCSNGVMFGFGGAIGNANGGLPALFVVSWGADWELR